MKQPTMHKKIFFILSMIISLYSHAQQQFTHTAIKENISCNYDCTMLDVPGLNNNAAAILFVNPMSEKGVNLNPHPIGAYYFKNKWHIFNLDSKPIPVGSKFTVEYFTKPDDSHFQYSFTRTDIQQDGMALIDHPALNNNPAAKFTSFLSWSPETQGATTNREEINIQYNTVENKWAVGNINKKPLFARAAYNISLTSGSNGNTKITNAQPAVAINQLTVLPNPNAVFGDIGMMFMGATADGIKLPGDNLVLGHLDQTQLYSLEMGANNLSGRKNTYDPITIRVHSGCPMFIPLLNAFINKQSMIFNIEALTTKTSSGKAAAVYTLKLSGAYISIFKQVFDEETSAATTKIISPRKVYDEIKIVFTKIEYITAGATATDNQ